MRTITISCHISLVKSYLRNTVNWGTLKSLTSPIRYGNRLSNKCHLDEVSTSLETNLNVNFTQNMNLRLKCGKFGQIFDIAHPLWESII